MAITKDQILKAVEGKAAERGLLSERQGDLVFITYPEIQDDREDNLHKQSIRALIKRIAPDWMIHLNSTDHGFTVEVRPRPTTSPDGPVTDKAPSGEDRIARLEKMLEQLLEQQQVRAE